MCSMGGSQRAGHRVAAIVQRCVTTAHTGSNSKPAVGVCVYGCMQSSKR